MDACLRYCLPSCDLLCHWMRFLANHCYRIRRHCVDGVYTTFQDSDPSHYIDILQLGQNVLHAFPPAVRQPLSHLVPFTLIGSPQVFVIVALTWCRYDDVERSTSHSKFQYNKLGKFSYGKLFPEGKDCGWLCASSLAVSIIRDDSRRRRQRAIALSKPKHPISIAILFVE